MRLQFENRTTVRQHIERMLRIERITEPSAVQHEVDAYAHLLPDGTNWKATLFIELADAVERARELPQLSEAAHRIYVDIPGHGRVTASANDDLADRHIGRPSAVHFLCFQFSAAQRAALSSVDTAILGSAHAAYPFRALIGAPGYVRLLNDFAPVQPLSTRASPCVNPLSPTRPT